MNFQSKDVPNLCFWMDLYKDYMSIEYCDDVVSTVRVIADVVIPHTKGHFHSLLDDLVRFPIDLLFVAGARIEDFFLLY